MHERSTLPSSEARLWLVTSVQHAHGLYLQATKSPIALQSLIERASAQRDVLHADAIALATRGLVNPDSLREVKRNNGHRALVVDLQIPVQTFREKLPELQGKSHVTAQELDQVVMLIDTLTQAIGTKEHSPQAREQTITVRAKALRMVANAWDEVRSAVSYVRRKHGDAELIAPSLYSNRGSAKTAPEPVPEPEQPASSASTGVHPSVQRPANGTPEPVAVGMPGASPYTSG